MEYPVKIDVSARHVHLSKNDAEILFGKGYELTEKKKIAVGSLAHERLTLIGPKASIENVAILLPFRDETQVEISLTDTYKLGVVAPIRLSGEISGSAPIVLKGPKGKLKIQEGVIVAKRHIHIGPSLAEKIRVTNNDIVRVRVNENQRSIVFDDVAIRVCKAGKNENIPNMHIDTDEANAAAIMGHADGTIIVEK